MPGEGHGANGASALGDVDRRGLLLDSARRAARLPSHSHALDLLLILDHCRVREAARLGTGGCAHAERGSQREDARRAYRRRLRGARAARGGARQWTRANAEGVERDGRRRRACGAQAVAQKRAVRAPKGPTPRAHLVAGAQRESHWRRVSREGARA